MMLRTTYAGFTRAVDLYFDHLMARVVPLQVRPGSLGALPLSLAPSGGSSEFSEGTDWEGNRLMAEMGNARCSVSISAVLLAGGPLPKVIGQWGGSDGLEAQVAVLGVTRAIPRSAWDQSILGPPGLGILALCSPHELSLWSRHTFHDNKNTSRYLLGASDIEYTDLGYHTVGWAHNLQLCL